MAKFLQKKGGKICVFAQIALTLCQEKETKRCLDP